MTVFETETMAELCVKQGLVSEALAIYRRLVDAAADGETRARRASRLAELERVAAGAARRRAEPVAPSPTTAPAAPGEATLTLERQGDQLTFTWAVPPDTAAPALQVLLLVRGPEGVEAQTRTLPLEQTAGTATLRAAGLHSARAAVGRLDGERFVPLARIS
jgi:hypothetical protein